MEEDEEREEDEGEELLECEGDLVVSFLLVSIVLLLADGNGSVFYRFSMVIILVYTWYSSSFLSCLLQMFKRVVGTSFSTKE